MYDFEKLKDKSLTSEDIELIRASFRAVAQDKDKVAELFYSRLFELDPTLRRLFNNTNMVDQRKKLMATIAVAVGALDKLDQVVPTVQELGVKHVSYGVKEEHYETVGIALIDTLSLGFGADFTPATKAAWT